MDSISEDSDGTRMNTRYKGRKHVNVYDVKLAMTCGKSILKGHVKYTKFMNSNLNLFRTLNKASFHAHKNALTNHKDICIDKLCDICSYIAQVKNYTWDVKNYARYLVPLPNEQPKTLKQKKTVRFVKSPVKEKLAKGLSLNIVSLELACTYNVSRRETGLLSVEI